jgi:outer membrane lipoprotein-sorting protein
MKYRRRVLCLALASCLFTIGQAERLHAQQPGTTASNANLERILNKMDVMAASFHTTEAGFVWEQYQKVVDETDTQKGKIYFRRAGHETQMAAEVTDPDVKCVLFADGKIQLYQPKIDQVTTYNAGKDRDLYESYIVLGFGAGGHDMEKSFDIKYLGQEKVGGLDTAKLDLVPKSVKVRNTFQHIILWIDPARGISVQQQFVEPTGDFRLTKYFDIRMNQKLPDSAFKLKTTSKTKFVSPQG